MIDLDRFEQRLLELLAKHDAAGTRASNKQVRMDVASDELDWTTEQISRVAADLLDKRLIWRRVESGRPYLSILEAGREEDRIRQEMRQRGAA